MMINADQLREDFVRRHGLMVGGSELWKALGFPTYAAFYRSWSKGTLGVRVFAIPGRKGQFALSDDIVKWVVRMAESPATLEEEDNLTDAEGKHMT